MLIYMKNNDKYGSKTYPLKRERADKLRIGPMDPCIGFIGFDPDYVSHIKSGFLMRSESLWNNSPECKNDTYRSYFSMMISTSIYTI